MKVSHPPATVIPANFRRGDGVLGRAEISQVTVFNDSEY